MRCGSRRGAGRLKGSGWDQNRRLVEARRGHQRRLEVGAGWSAVILLCRASLLAALLCTCSSRRARASSTEIAVSFSTKRALRRVLRGDRAMKGCARQCVWRSTWRSTWHRSGGIDGVGAHRSSAAPVAAVAAACDAARDAARSCRLSANIDWWLRAKHARARPQWCTDREEWQANGAGTDASVEATQKRHWWAQMGAAGCG